MDQSGVTVVVAVWGSLAALDECLSSLARQRDEAVQILIVSAVAVPPDLTDRFGCGTVILGRSTDLIPHLWATGIARAQHPIVAITTSHFVPADNYIPALRAAHGRLDAVGIGGRIEPRSDGDSTTWATYFLRYSTYLSWETERGVRDFAGDNGSYKRDALLAASCLNDAGFWEQPIHRLLIARGYTLAYVPAIGVTQYASFGLVPFCRQRFQHGAVFGRERVDGAPLVTRLARILSAPIIPFVLFAKVATRACAARRYAWPFVRSLPVLALFIGAWSAGEAFGYVTGSKTTPATASHLGVPSA